MGETGEQEIKDFLNPLPVSVNNKISEALVNGKRTVTSRLN